MLARFKRARLPATDLFDGPPRHGGRLQPLITLIEVLLVIAMALLAGKAFWALFAPLPIAQSPPAPSARPAALAAAGNPFRALAVDAPVIEAAPVAVETTLDLKLHGTWHDGEGRGTAVIQASGAPQKVFRIGEDICCGAKLEEVYADRVIISRGGAREAVLLPNKRSDSQTTEAPSAAPALTASAPIVSVQLLGSGGGVSELRLFPSQDPAAFEALGLRPGDILVSVNGMPAQADVAATARLISTLSPDDIMGLTIKRDGVEFPLDVSVRDWLGATGRY